MRFIIVAIILLVFDLYPFQALLTLSDDWSDYTKWLSFIAYWSITFLALTILFGLIVSDYTKWNRRLFNLIRTIVTIGLICKGLMALVLCIDDIWRGILGLLNPDLSFPRTKLAAGIALGMGLGPFLLLIYGIIRNPHRYKVFKQDIFIEDLPSGLDGLKIVQISDIHVGSFGPKKPVQKGIDLINKECPDIVLFTGDLVNSVSYEMTPFLEVFDKIESNYGIWCCLGNHDYGDYVNWHDPADKVKHMDYLYELYNKMGWKILNNAHEVIDVNGEKVAVIGVENYSAKPQLPKYGDLTKAKASLPPVGLKLLLSHDPSHWQEKVVPNHKDIDVMFAGHTHGMQFGFEWPGGIKWSPIKYLYKEWAGLYQDGKQYLYVNRGFGYLAYPGRIGILPEITSICIKKKVNNV